MKHGQWIGQIEGDPGGLAVLDLDKDGSTLQGTACLFPDDPAAVNTVALIDKIDTSGTPFEIPIYPLDHAGGIVGFDNLANLFPGVTHSQSAKITLKTSGKSLDVTFATDSDTYGAGKLHLSDADKPSKLTPVKSVTDWATFKEYVRNTVLEKQYHFMFRGQPCINRLRTTFHRTNRSDLNRFKNTDIPLLRRYLSPSMQHFFDMNDPIQVGAFYNLLQHHGYPTPLLDWSYSPYISAYFAFANANTSNTKAVRIFQFKSDIWQKTVRQIPIIANVRPHFSIIELLGIENPRMIPQQALSTLTNVDDIETYIMNLETKLGQKFLDVIELPISEKNIALSELTLMGINEATLFPGLQTSCSFLRSRMFEQA